MALRPGDTELAAAMHACGCRVVEVAEAERGMGRSLAEGVATLSASDPLVVGLADMPFVTAETLRGLAAALEDAVSDCAGAIVQPRHGGRPGNPVGFGPARIAELAACDGDRGARDVVRAAAACGKVRYLDVDDAGVLQDVDRPEY